MSRCLRNLIPKRLSRPDQPEQRLHQGQVLGPTGDDLLAALSGADASQEIKRATVPHTTEEFLIHKARLTFLLKQINRAGEALWIDDPTRRSDCNLSILYRRWVSRKGKDGTPETETGGGTAGGETKG